MRKKEIDGKVVVPITWLLEQTEMGNCNFTNEFLQRGKTNQVIASAIFNGDSSDHEKDLVLILDSKTGEKVDAFYRDGETIFYYYKGNIKVIDNGEKKYNSTIDSITWNGTREEEIEFNRTMCAIIGRRNCPTLKSLCPVKGDSAMDETEYLSISSLNPH